MTKLESFTKFLETNKLTANLVPADWPFNYGENTAHVVTFKGVTQYLFFNDSGDLLVQKRVDTTE